MARASRSGTAAALGVACLVSLLLAPARSAADGPARVPDLVLRTIRESTGAWIVRLGGTGSVAPADLLEMPRAQGPIAGREVLDRFELPPEAANAFASVLGARGSYAAPGAPGAAGAGGLTRVGFTFECQGEFAHVVCAPSSGSAQIVYFNGYTTELRLSPHGRARWESALRAYLRKRGLSRKDFDLAFGANEPPAQPPR